MPEGASDPADHLAVQTLIARIAQLADMGDLDEYVECFTDDARWEMPGAPRVGRAAIREGGTHRRSAGEAGPGSHSRHVVNTIAVSVAGDIARATSYWQFYVDTASGSPRLHSLGAYDDEFIRDDGVWRLATRRITRG